MWEGLDRGGYGIESRVRARVPRPYGEGWRMIEFAQDLVLIYFGV